MFLSALPTQLVRIETERLGGANDGRVTFFLVVVVAIGIVGAATR